MAWVPLVLLGTHKVWKETTKNYPVFGGKHTENLGWKLRVSFWSIIDFSYGTKVMIRSYLSPNRSNYSSKMSNLLSFTLMLLFLDSNLIISILSFPRSNKNGSKYYQFSLKHTLFHSIYQSKRID